MNNKREVNLMCLLHEVVNRKKYIFISGIIFAIVCMALFCMNVYNNQQQQVYASTGKMFVESVKDKDDVFFEIEKNDNSELVSVISSDYVLNKVLKDYEIASMNLNIEELRSKIYIYGQENNSIFEISVVDKNLQDANLICKKVIETSIVYLNDKGYETEIIQDATDMGAVTVTIEAMAENPKETFAIIESINEANLSVKGILENGIIGLILGALICGVLVCITYRMRDIIIYPEQIEDSIGTNVINSCDFDSILWSMYKTADENMTECDKIVFVCLNDSTEFDNYIEEFIQYADRVKKCKKNILYLQHEDDKIVDVINDYHDESNNYNIMYINDSEIINQNSLNNIINSSMEKYDMIIFKLSNVLNNPIKQLVYKSISDVVLFVEKNTIKTKQLISVVDSIHEANEDNNAIVVLRDNK